MSAWLFERGEERKGREGGFVVVVLCASSEGRRRWRGDIGGIEIGVVCSSVFLFFLRFLQWYCFVSFASFAFFPPSFMREE